MAEPSVYTIDEPVCSGDSWDGVPSMRVRVGGAAPTQALESVEVTFGIEGDPASRGLTLTSGEGGGVTILDAADWRLKIDAIEELPLAPGVWRGRMRFVAAGGRRKSWAEIVLTVV